MYILYILYSNIRVTSSNSLLCVTSSFSRPIGDWCRSGSMWCRQTLSFKRLVNSSYSSFSPILTKLSTRVLRANAEKNVKQILEILLFKILVDFFLNFTWAAELSRPVQSFVFFYFHTCVSFPLFQTCLVNLRIQKFKIVGSLDSYVYCWINEPVIRKPRPPPGGGRGLRSPPGRLRASPNRLGWLRPYHRFD